MDCSQVDILLVDYLYGELPEQQRQDFELHLQSCARHAKEIERMRTVLTVMRRDRREDPSDRVSKEILRAAEESIHRTSRPWGWLNWIRTPLAAAAALLVVIGIGTVVYFNEGFDRRFSESGPNGRVLEKGIPKSSVRNGDAVPNVADTLVGVPKDDRNTSERQKPALKITPSPQKMAEGVKGSDEKAIRLSREPKPKPQAYRDEEIAQELGVGEPAARAFTPKPEEYKKKHAGSADAAVAEKPKVETHGLETALQPSAAAPPPVSQKEVSMEGNLAPRNAPSRTAPSEPVGEALDKELPPLSNSDVMEVVRKHWEEFRACGRKYPSVKGTMFVSFVIANDGTVSSVATLTEEFKGTAYAECISSEIKKILFPPFGGEPKTVRFPFTVK